VAELLRKAQERLGLQPQEVEVEVPKEASLGDLSSPLAMHLARSLRRPPREIARELLEHLPETDAFERTEVAGPGFLNFFFRREFLYQELARLLQEGEGFLHPRLEQGRRVQVEFVSANPTGPLHLGHGRGAAVGAAVANLLKAAGAEVVREYYVNDAGRQVALLGESVFSHYQALLGSEHPFPQEGYRGQYVKELAQELASRVGERFKAVPWQQAREDFSRLCTERMLALIRQDLSAFGVEFDRYQSERALFEESTVEKTLEILRQKGLLYTQEGALWFRASALGDEKDRVLRKSDGEYTYFASDVAYHEKKVLGGYDELVNVWGADHHGYVPRVRAALRALGYEPQKLRVLLVQMVTLLRGGVPVQMSKRAGEFITLREVIEEVGPDTTKFIFLTRRPDSHLEFDLEVAKATSAENPVYYVQYAHARIMSILRHARAQGLPTEPATGQEVLQGLQEPEEVDIIKKLLLYPMAFEQAVRGRQPHRITYYLQELAGLFHPYYNRHRIVGPQESLSLARLALVQAVLRALRAGLALLGIRAPERM